jgi:hypothetical protein
MAKDLISDSGVRMVSRIQQVFVSFALHNRKTTVVGNQVNELHRYFQKTDELGADKVDHGSPETWLRVGLNPPLLRKG